MTRGTGSLCRLAPFGPLEVTQKALKVKVLTLFILEVTRRLHRPHSLPRSLSLSLSPSLSLSLAVSSVCFAY